MKFIFDYILEKQPWVVRVIFYTFCILSVLIGGSFTAGWKLLPNVNAHIVGVVTTWAEPRALKRDSQIKEVNTKLDSIAYAQNSQAEDIRDIRNALMDKNKN